MSKSGGRENDEFQQWSYESHEEHLTHYSFSGEKRNHAKTWYDPHTVDAWRHRRMYQLLDPILEMYPQATWVTIGDGRFGNDAHYIQDKNIKVVATDIADCLLKEAKEIGHIENYQKENAELMSFASNSFDYAFCKESLHHFPRPFAALYEMLRVSRMGIVSIEPMDELIKTSIAQNIFQKLKLCIKFILRRPHTIHHFEESGNYVYSFSKREMMKLAIALNLKTIVFKGLNDVYAENVEYETADETSVLFKRIKIKLLLKNLFCKMKLTPYGLLFTFIIKNKIGKSFKDELTSRGYQVIELPDNPYYPRQCGVPVVA